jgi:hypothetical protein
MHDRSLNTNCGCDIIKAIIFFLIFLVGLASAYTPVQTALNATALNATALNEIAANETTPKELTIIPVSTKLKDPFNAGSELSKFGKKQVYDL